MLQYLFCYAAWKAVLTEPIFDSNGRVVGWLRGQLIYDLGGNSRAFLHGDCVSSNRGRHLGRMDRGFFRDRSGNAVAFLKGARGGPILPVPEVPPVPPIPAVPPVPPVSPVPPVPPVPSLSWSPLSWARFLEG